MAYAVSWKPSAWSVADSGSTKDGLGGRWVDAEEEAGGESGAWPTSLVAVSVAAKNENGFLRPNLPLTAFSLMLMGLVVGPLPIGGKGSVADSEESV